MALGVDKRNHKKQHFKYVSLRRLKMFYKIEHHPEVPDNIHVAFRFWGVDFLPVFGVP